MHRFIESAGEGLRVLEPDAGMARVFFALRADLGQRPMRLSQRPPKALEAVVLAVASRALEPLPLESFLSRFR